jgi:hypothetical protein
MARFLVGERDRNTNKPKILKSQMKKKNTLLQGNKTYGGHTSILNSKNS